MKKVIVTTRKEDLGKIESELKGTLHFVRKEGDLIRIFIYIHDRELDDLIICLDNVIDLRYRENMIEVFTPEFIVSSFLTRSEEKAGKSRERTPVEKLIDSTKPHVKLDTSKIALTTIAGLIALSGLFMNNIPIIIGAMLLSPLLGPIQAFTINTAVGKAKYVFRSMVILSILLGMVLVFSFLATLLISTTVDLSLTPEILARIDPSFIYMFMAVLLGFASIFALSKDISESIAGVAVAAALLPPAAVTGIALVLYPSEAVASFVLTLENVLGLMAGGLLATLFLDIEPRKYHRRVPARKFILRTSVVLIILLVLLFVLSFWLCQ